MTAPALTSGIVHAICPRCFQPHTPWCPAITPRRASWPGFSADQRDRAWQRLAATVAYGTAADIRSATDYLVYGPSVRGCPSLTRLDSGAWDRLADKLRILAGLSDLTILWHEVYDIDALGPGDSLQSAAEELAEREAKEAWLDLLASAA